jgi:ribosomal protein S12 methylthiotransferase
MKKNSFYIVSLGCAKNLVDSNVLAQLLETEGLTYARSAKQAEFVLVNTCGFIHDARQESLDTLQELSNDLNLQQKIIATGCLAERWRDELLRQNPRLNGFIGTRSLEDILPLVHRLKSNMGAEGTAYPSYPALRYPYGTSYTAIQGGSSYLKIADGCHRSCAFCAIPGIKGPLVSRPKPDVVQDALFLQSEGVREINLIAQDLTAYGIDRGEKDGLANLIAKLLPQIPDVPWVRLLYTYPGMVTDRLIDLMAAENQLVPYLDIPLQHADPDVLRKMRRPSDVNWVRCTIQKMRARISGLAVRTTFIVGFPNETEESFQTLVDFVNEIGFDHLGVFTYSPEADTESFGLPDIVPQEVKDERKDRLMELQSHISEEKNQSLIGQTLDVLVEGQDEAQGIIVGRSYRDAPEIDGLVVARSSAQTGEITRVKIETAGPYDLFGSQVLSS